MLQLQSMARLHQRAPNPCQRISTQWVQLQENRNEAQGSAGAAAGELNGSKGVMSLYAALQIAGLDILCCSS